MVACAKNLYVQLCVDFTIFCDTLFCMIQVVAVDKGFLRPTGSLLIIGV